MPTLRYTLCDVFTDRPLSGNALAVFTEAASLDPDTMQAVAREMNLSESVFLLPPERGGHFRLRIFTPRREVPFAGHPTLGAALVIGRSVALERLVLETDQGPVEVRIEREPVVFGWMSQPIPTIAPLAAAGDLLAALGLARSTLPVELYDNGIRHALVAAEDSRLVAELTPDLGRLQSLPVEAVSVFAAADGTWKTRVFAPACGIAEDPATGSAAGPLGWHLARHDRAPYDTELVIEQGAEVARPAKLYVRVRGHGQVAQQIEVGGQAVVVGRGELRL